MKKAEKKAIIAWAQKLTNDELEEKYYNSVFDSLGSETEKMYELGYDMRDIEEREKYEKYLIEKADLLRNLCDERGIELWKDK